MSAKVDQILQDVKGLNSSELRELLRKMADSIELHDELILDGNARQNLAAFCTTWVEPEARQLMAESIDKNMIDKDEYPQTAEIERRAPGVSRDLAALLLDDIRRSIAFFAEHPVSKPLSRDEAGSYNHSGR
jgi:hypothetical protein